MNNKVTFTTHQTAHLSKDEIHRVTTEYLLSIAGLHEDDYLNSDKTKVMEDVNVGHGSDITEVKRDATDLDIQVFAMIHTLNVIKSDKEQEAQRQANENFELRTKVAMLERELAQMSAAIKHDATL